MIKLALPAQLLCFIFIAFNAFSQQGVPVDKEKLLEFYQNQRYGDAAKYLQSIYPSEINDSKVLNQIAYFNLMAGNLPEAEKNYLKVVALDPKALPAYFNLASINVRRGNYLNAKANYLNILNLDSNNFNANKQLAHLYESENDTIRLVYLKKANQLNPIESDVALDLAKAYQKTKHPEQAYKTLSIAIAADTANYVLQEALLPIANQLKKYQEVIRIGDKILEMGVDANVLKDVGIAQFNLKKYKLALTYFNKIETIAMENESSLYYTTLCYRNLAEYELAIKYANKTIESAISTNTPSYYLLLGGIQEINNQNQRALSAYKRGLTFGKNPETLYRLAVIYDFKLNQKSLAIQNYKAYLNSKLNPKTDQEQIDFAKLRLVEMAKK